MDDYGTVLARLYEESTRRGASPVFEPDWCVFVEIELYRLTGLRRYLDSIARATRLRLEEYRARGIVPGKLTGFKLPVRLGYAARLLVSEKVLSESEVVELRRFLSDLLLHAEYERGAMNRAVGFMAALHPVLGVITDHPNLAQLLELEELVLSDWKARWEPIENAYGYEALTLIFVLLWFEESGRDHLIRTDQMRTTLERLLHTRANDGTGVAFGDWRPSDRATGLYLAIFERAAQILHDGRYRWVADQLWKSWLDRLERDEGTGGESLFGLAIASRWADRTIEPVVPNSGSTVLPRGTVANKLIVRHGWQESGLFAMISLSHGHEHSHNDVLAVNAITKGGTTLLGDNGRNRPEQRAHNMVCSGEDLPTLFEAGNSLPLSQWQAVRLTPNAPRQWGHFTTDRSIPLQPGHFVGNNIPPEFDYDPAHQSVLCFGVTGTGKMTLRVRECVLRGPGAEIDLLEGIRTKGREVAFEVHPDSEKQYAAFEGFSVAHCGSVLPFPLDLASPAYDTVELTLRLDAESHDADIHFICIGDCECVPKKWKPADSPQGSAVVHRLESDGESTRALLEIEDVVPSGRSRKRMRGVFAYQDRFLSVRDTILYADRRPFAAAQLWHSRHEPEQLANGWFLIGDEARLLVTFAPTDSVGPEHYQISWKHSGDPERHNPYTLFCAGESRGDTTLLFDALLLIPRAGEDLDELVSTARVVRDPDGYLRCLSHYESRL